MASTYSDLKIELIGTGEQAGTWGATTNTNLGTAIEEAIVGYATANFTSDANLTLTLTNSNSTQVARNFVLNATSSGSLTATRDLIVPLIQKPYLVRNNTTGGQAIRVIGATGTGYTIPSGRSAYIYNDGTNVSQAFDSMRLDPRIGTVTSASTITPTGDLSDQYNVTALATDATIAAPSGTPVNGQRLIIRILDNGTSRNLTWTSTSGAYRDIGAVLPAATTANKTIYVGCVYNSAATYWDVVAVVEEV